ncbi:MFS transporter [Pseudoroseomonas sp. WGS1072]|uniref:MFS transporter n=1 Tax=Roseomonas sp. WGS1072 TaxID=3366816 RepID=UPI003BF2C0DA
MSEPEEHASPATMPGERRNVTRLAIAQALAGANATIIFATGAVMGNTLAPDKSLATLPITLFVLGMASGTIPSGALASRYGRRASFLFGAACGVLVGLLSAYAVLIGSFWLFCGATFFGGAYASVAMSLRFAAADCAPPQRRARAISLVMAGGVFAGVLGPQLVTHTMDLWPPYLFAVTYLAQAGLAVLCALVLMSVRVPSPRMSGAARGRPLAEIARQPRFIAAVAAGAVSYLIMNFLMTSAPLAMRLCGLTQGDANLGLQWHVIAMYGPAFFTGGLIARFGAPRVVLAGLFLSALAAVAGLSGLSVGHFWLSLILLGLGWNFGFVGASTMVVDSHRPEERAKVQSLNDFLVFGVMVVGSLASGGLLNRYGWAMVCWVSIPPLLLAAATLWLAREAPARRPA